MTPKPPDACRNTGAPAQGVLGILKSTWTDFGRNECATRAAALAYATVFALTPLLVLLISVAGLIWSPAEVQRALESQFAGVLGSSGAAQIHDMIAHGRSSAGRGIVATVGSALGLLLGATGVLLALQDALNRAWNVTPDPAQGGVRAFLMKRLLSAGMVLGFGFILAVSLALTAGLSAMGGAVGGAAFVVVFEIVNFVASFAVLALLFGAMFKVLPDAQVAWHDVWVGGGVTALLFVVGKFVIGLYLGHSKPGDAFGAASALALILVWAYYSGMIILLGAEFTQEWAGRHGHVPAPVAGAMHANPAPVVDTAATMANNRTSHDPPRADETVRRSGLVDWMLALPVLLLLRQRRKEP